MDHGAEDGDNAINEHNYFYYKTYIRIFGYIVFIIYSLIGIKRLYDHINQWLILEQCTWCQPYEEKPFALLWSISELLLYGFAPLSALFALIYADLERCFPSYAIRMLFPSFVLVVPIIFTIFSYILYWFIDLIIDVQQISDNLYDMEVWKRCIRSSALFITNIYCLLIAAVVMQLIYYQHYLIIEDQIMLEQQNLINDGGRVQHQQNRRHQRQFINQPVNDAGFRQNQEDLNNNDNDNNPENIVNFQ